MKTSLNIKKLIKTRIQKMFRKNIQFRSAILHELAEEGVYFFKTLKDHNIVFFPQDHIGKMIMQYGQFNRLLVQDLDAFLTKHGRSVKSKTVLEIGANIGTSTIYFFKDMECAHVVAIEPEPENMRLLQINIGINDLINSVTAIQKGASSRKGELSFVTNRHNMGGSYIGKIGHNAPEGFRQTTVAVSSIDDLLDEPAAIGLVWIDVEGHESDVFAGMIQLIEKVRPPILFEYAPVADPTRSIADILAPFYTNVYRYSGGAFEPIGMDGLRNVEIKGDFLAL